jgi:predicted Fe-Mo cluster-binding NifX family protein
LVGNLFGINLDRLTVFVVIIFIAHAGIAIFIDAVRVLLDASLDFETLDRVRKIISAERSVKEIKFLIGRNSGRYKFIEADVILNVRELEKAHLISKKIEKSIKDEITNVDHVIIHYEPIQKDTFVYSAPLDDIGGKLSKHFGEAPYFAIVTVGAGDKTFKNREILSNPFLSEERGKGILVSEFLIKQGIDVILLREKFDGRGPEYVLSDSSVEVIITDAETLNDALLQQSVLLEV